MNNKFVLYVDQYGQRFTATSSRLLRKQIANGSSTVHKMYVNNKNGVTYHVGYVIGKHYLTAYSPVEISA